MCYKSRDTVFHTYKYTPMLIKSTYGIHQDLRITKSNGLGGKVPELWLLEIGNSGSQNSYRIVRLHNDDY